MAVMDLLKSKYDFKIEPDDGVFQVGVSEMLTIAGRRSAEMRYNYGPETSVRTIPELSFG